MGGLGWQEILVLLIVVGVVYVVFFSTPVRRRLDATRNVSTAQQEPAARAESPEDVLAMRFARGEINQTEYEAMRAVIQPDRNRT